MGCGATKSQHEEEDEYYEEESRSVQTSARLLNRGITPPATRDDPLERTSKPSDEERHSKSLESDKWDTFEIESSTNGNNTADGRIKSAERLLIKDEFDHPNRVVSASQRNRRTDSPRRYRRSPSPPRRERRSSLSPPRNYRRDSYEASTDRRRRHDSTPRDYNRKQNPHHHNDQRRSSRGYDSDYDEYEKQRMRNIEQARRRLEDDYDEGYKSDHRRGPSDGYQRPSMNNNSYSSGDSGRYQPRRPPPQHTPSNRNVQANRNANGVPSHSTITRRPHSDGDVPATTHAHLRSPNKLVANAGSTWKQPASPAQSKMKSRDLDSHLKSPRKSQDNSIKTVASRKAIAANVSPSKTAANASKPSQNGAPPPWRLSYAPPKPNWAV